MSSFICILHDEVMISIPSSHLQGS